MYAHHKLIKNLIIEIRQLRRDLDSANYQIEDLEGSAYRAQERAELLNREARHVAQMAREAQSDAEYRDYERQQALRYLARPLQGGDEWNEQKAIRKLRDL